MVETTKGGADYTFDCTGNTNVMRQALESASRGWGVSVVIGVAESGHEIATRPFQLITGRTWKGTAFGGARGRTDVPRIVDWYMDGKIEIDPLITHTMPLDEINSGVRPDARRREHPQRGALLRRNRVSRPLVLPSDKEERPMKGIGLWLIGIPIPIIILLYIFVFN